jgi:hypothetical protein
MKISGKTLNQFIEEWPVGPLWYAAWTEVEFEGKFDTDKLAPLYRLYPSSTENLDPVDILGVEVQPDKYVQQGIAGLRSVTGMLPATRVFAAWKKAKKAHGTRKHVGKEKP